MTGSLIIAACFLALLFASSAVSSKSVLLKDHGHQDFRPAHTFVDSQSYHVEYSNGLGFPHRLVTPKRFKGTARKLAIISETRNEEKQMTEKKSNSLDNANQSGGLPAKSTVNKQRDTRKIKHPPPSSSGARSMHTSQKEPSKRSEWTSLVAKKINVVDLHKHHHREKFDQLPNLNADYHGPKTHPPKHN